MLWHWLLIAVAVFAWIGFFKSPTRSALGDALLRTISAS